MARNRMIKADFWADEKVGSCSLTAQLLFIGSWNFADDSGVCRANSIYLRNNIFPYGSITVKQIDEALEQLADKKLISLGNYEGEKYLLIKNFLKHQQIKNPSQFRLITNDYKEIFKSYPSTNPALPLKEKGKEKGKEKEKEKDSLSCKQDIAILNYFNLKANKNFKPVESNLKFINARLKEYSEMELMAMIDFKVAEWKNNNEMSMYLRPETLFNATKCASYIEESKKTPTKPTGKSNFSNPIKPNYKTTQETKALLQKYEDNKKIDFAPKDFNREDAQKWLNKLPKQLHGGILAQEVYQKHGFKMSEEIQQILIQRGKLSNKEEL